MEDEEPGVIATPASRKTSAVQTSQVLNKWKDSREA
jgi:hypothetical protein